MHVHYVHSTLRTKKEKKDTLTHILNNATYVPTNQTNKQTINYRTSECPALRTGVVG